jgi:hypothetical protein
MRALALALLLAPASAWSPGHAVPNQTSIMCQYTMVSGDVLNCTITTRNTDGQPAPGARFKDLVVVPPPELLAVSDEGGWRLDGMHKAMWGGTAETGYEWYVEYRTCKAGEFNVTVITTDVGDAKHGWSNATATATIVPALITNISLDCRRQGGGFHSPVVAGMTVGCVATTTDMCGNPSTIATETLSTWSAELTGKAMLNPAYGLSVLPAAELEPSGAHYWLRLDTALYWDASLNVTDYGVAGAIVTYTNLNWTHTAEHDLYIQAAPLAASTTQVVCEPQAGLLQWHTATCYVYTFDVFQNPQVGAPASAFTATFLSNPGPLGEYAGPVVGPLVGELEGTCWGSGRCGRGPNVFSIDVQAFEVGDNAGVQVSVFFASNNFATAKGTFRTVRTELLVRPDSAVMNVPPAKLELALS